MQHRFLISFMALIPVILGLSRGWAQPPPEKVPVQGSVVDEKTKEPVQGAQIRFRPREAAGISRASTTTTATGEYSLELAEGEYEVSVRANGYRGYVRQVKVNPQTLSLPVTLIPLPVLQGRILQPEGVPLAQTSVQLQRRLTNPDGGSRWSDTVTTDAAGRYRASFEGSGKLHLRVIAPGVGYAQSGPWEVAQEDVEGGDLILQPAASVSGVVTAQTTGAPVEGAWVAAEWWNPPDPERMGRVKTDEQGRFTLPDLPGGRYNLQLSAPDFLRRSHPLHLEDGQNQEELKVSLPPAVTLTAQLLGPEGLPLAHREVQGVVGVQKRLRPGLRNQEDLITTDGEGCFSIKLNDVGFSSLTLFQLDLGVAFLRFPVREGEDLQQEVQMQPFSPLRGSVRDQRTKHPIAGAQVQASLQSPWGFSRLVGSPEARTDEQGTFELTGLIPGDWNLRVQKAGYGNHRQRVALLVGRESLEVVMEMQRARTYHLTGQVLDADGEPFVGARVRAGNEEQRTDAKGRFAFGGRSNPVRSLQVEAPGWDRVQKPIPPDPGKEEQEVTVVIRYHGGTLAGRVRGEGSEKPVEGAWVIPWDAYASDHPSSPRYWEDPEIWEDPGSRRRARERLRRLPHAFTDEQGRFRIENVGEGEYFLQILGADLHPTLHPGVEVREGSTTELELEVRFRGASPPSPTPSPRGAETLSGRFLTPEGKPMEYSEVFWVLQLRSGEARSTVSGNTQTDEKGHFTIDNRRAQSNFFAGPVRFPATADLTLFVEGFHPVEFRGLEVEKEGKTPFLEAQLKKPQKGGFIGQVLLPDGHTPGSGLHVIPFTKNRFFPPTQGERANSHHGTGGDTLHFAARLAVTTDQEGFFHLEGFWPGEYGLFISPWTNPESLPPSFPPGDPLNQVAFPWIQMVQIPEGQNRELEITLRPTGSLAGTAINQAGQPLAGVKISAPPSRSGVFFGGRPETVTTDPQGRFILPRLAPGKYGVYGIAEGYQGWLSREIEVPAGGKVADLRVQMFSWPPGILEGQVVQPDGRPVENARLFLPSWPGGRILSRTEATSDEEGRFTLENVNPGKYQIVAAKVGWAGGESVPFKLPPGARLTGLTIPLQEGGKVRGQVRDAAGQPAVGVMVAAAPEHHDVRNFGPLPWRPFLNRQTRTDEEGRFELRRVLPGEAQVFVFTETPGSRMRSGPFRGLIRDARRKVKVPPGETTDPVLLRLWPAEGVIRGTVTQGDGTPLENVTVEPYNNFLPGWTFRAQTGVQGKFRIEGLPPGTYHLYAEAEGWAGRSLQDLVLAPEKPQAEVALTLSEGGTIQGQVVDPEGQPMGGVQVRTGTQGRNRMPENGLTRGSEWTAADGTFILSPLAPGEYELTCITPDYTEKKVPAVVQEGETATVEVVMEKE